MTPLAAALLAAVPIAVILALMVGARWPAWRAGLAGLAGLAVTLVVAVGPFGYGRAVLPDLGVGGALLGAFAEAGFTALTILWIIVPALAIHQLQLATGATDVLRLALGRLSRDPGITALLVAWFFVLFMEGAAGFGASVALAAPFLVSAGFRRVDAVTIALVGHAIGVSFGAVGTPIIPQMAATGLGGRELVGWTALAAALFLGPYQALAWFVGPELPTLGGALVGGLAFVGVLRWRSGRRPAARPALADNPGHEAAAQPPPTPDGAAPDDPAGVRRVGRAAAPYIVLVGLVLVTRLVPPLTEMLGAVTMTWSLEGGFAGSVQPLYHPGTMLLGGFLGGALVQRVAGRQVRAALHRTVAQLGAVTLALVAMLALSRVMVHGELTAALAAAAVAGAGAGWPLLAPAGGALALAFSG